VEREQKRVLMPDGQVVPKPEGNAQLDDVLVADLTFRDGDTVINEAKEIQIRVQKQLVLSDALARNFEEQVKGVSAGDTRVVDLELSSQSANPALRGKTIKMEIVVKDVKAIRLPDLTEEYLSKFGVHTQESLRELIKVVLDRKLEFEQRQSARRQVAEYISSKAEWKLPEDLLVRQARRALARRQMEMQSEGIPEAEIASKMRLLQQDILRSTEISLKEHFVLQKIAETEKIEVNDDDLEAEIDRMAEQSGESARRVRARLEKEDMMEAVAAEMIERKALDLILDSATYEDVTIGEEMQEGTASVEEQVVPGEMRDVEAEAAAQKSEEQGDAPQS
jgi:trigger factor